MANNIEIKARCRDPEQAKLIAVKLGGQYIGRDHQIDTYFKSENGRLKLRESSLNGTKLIPYLRPNQTGPKKSDYMIIPILEGKLCKTMLSQILGVEAVVDKIRLLYFIGNVRVHIDSVRDIGDFFELEAVYNDPSQEPAEQEKVEKLLRAFEISPEDLIEGSYREMVLNS